MSWLEYDKSMKKTLKRSKPKVAANENQAVVVMPAKQDEGRENRLYEVKKRIHHCLLERLDLSQLEDFGIIFLSTV